MKLNRKNHTKVVIKSKPLLLGNDRKRNYVNSQYSCELVNGQSTVKSFGRTRNIRGNNYV